MKSVLTSALIFASTIGLMGCVTVQPTSLANGANAHILTCAFGIDTANRCYHAAGQLCGTRGFLTFDWQGQPVNLVHADPSDLDMNVRTEPMTLLVSCRS